MSDDKIKDAILRKAYGRTCVNPQTIEGDAEALQSSITSLHNEGLIKILKKGNNRGKVTVISYEITDAGTELVDCGGYVKRNRKNKLKMLSAKTWASITFVLGIVLTELVHILAEWLKP